MNRLIGWIQLMAARLGEKCFQRTHKQFRIFPFSLPLFRSRYFVFLLKSSPEILSGATIVPSPLWEDLNYFKLAI